MIVRLILFCFVMFLLLRWLTACVALPPDQPKRDYSKKPVAFGVTFAPSPPRRPPNL